MAGLHGADPMLYVFLGSARRTSFSDSLRYIYATKMRLGNVGL